MFWFVDFALVVCGVMFAFHLFPFKNDLQFLQEYLHSPCQLYRNMLGYSHFISLLLFPSYFSNWRFWMMMINNQELYWSCFFWQQFHEWLSSKARPKPRSPSWSSQEEDLGQRLEARLFAAEQKRYKDFLLLPITIFYAIIYAACGFCKVYFSCL